MKRGYWAGSVVILLVLLSPMLLRVATGGAVQRVATSIARTRNIRASIIASGTFLYESQVQLSPEVLGRVTKVEVREGDVVMAGDILLRIQDTTYRSAVAQQAASVAGADSLVRQRDAELNAERRRLVRLTTLRDRGFATLASFEDADEVYKTASSQLVAARAGLAQSKAALSQAVETLRKTVIRAPTSGVVVALSTRVGETVVPSSVNLSGSSLLTIARSSVLVADVNVDEADIGRVSIGQEAVLTAAAFPDRPIRGLVQNIALTPGRNDTKVLGVPGNPSSQSRTYSVRVQVFPPAGVTLRAGMTCRTEIFSTNAGSALTVPVEAILAANGGDGTTSSGDETVFVVRNARVQRRKVTLATSDDRYQAVQTGLKEGDVVVTGPAETLHGLSDGDRIAAR